MTERIDWPGVARGMKLDIPRENIEAVAPLLDSLMEAFRPLGAQLDPVRDA
jgi:hypothetical protein